MTAQSRTPEGAKAFLDHYVALLNWAHQAADARPVATYEGPDCGLCIRTRTSIAALAAKKQHSAANLFAFEAVTPPDNADISPYVVPVTLVQNATAILDISGAEAGQFKAQSTQLTYVLEWTGLGWQVTDVRAAS